MISYWGIEHGDAVSKSYIPGKGWVPAVQAGKKALKGAQGGHAKAKGVSWEDRLFQTNQKNTKAFLGELGKPKTVTRNGVKMNKYTSDRMPPGVNAFATMTGKNKRHMVSPQGSPKWINRHEEAHLSPKKRTSYRLNQILTNPRKTMREEARADIAGKRNWRTQPKSNDPLRAHMMSGYAEAAGNPSKGRMHRQGQHNIRMAQLQHFKGENLKAVKANPNRTDMFGKRPLADYRKTQDKITGNSGPRGTTPVTRDNKLNDRAWQNTEGISFKNGVSTGKPINPRRPYMKTPGGDNPGRTRDYVSHAGPPPKRSLWDRARRRNG